MNNLSSKLSHLLKAFAQEREGATAWVDVPVFCKPGSGRRAIVGIHGDSLKVKVRAKAQDGRANQELVELFAEVCGVAPSSVRILSGDKSRFKKIRIVKVDLPSVVAWLQAAIEGRNLESR